VSLRFTDRPRAVVLRVPLAARAEASGRVPMRSALTCVALLALTVIVIYFALSLGTLTYSPGEVLRALLGTGTAQQELFVVGWRLPRALAAAVFGAMLGVSGALFQAVTRNPLGSPDIIGFTAGSSAASVAVIVLIGSGFYLVASGALVGGVAVGVLVMLLSRGGGVAGFRLVIAGLALNAMLVSVETWLVLNADFDVAQTATLWGAGSLNGADFEFTAAPMVLGGLVMLVTVLALGQLLDMLGMGDDAGAALGATPARTRRYAVAAGVVLIALVTAAAGPIAFVALAAPHVGRRLAGVPGVGLLPAGAAGAFLLSSADLAAQHAIPGNSYPVGVVTVVCGGLYLMTLLVSENRRAAL